MRRNCCRQNQRCCLRNLSTNVYCRGTLLGKIINGTFVPVCNQNCSCSGN